MEIIFLLILISLMVATGFLGAYLWATRTGQFDDDYTPSVRMLFDDELRDNERPAAGNTDEENVNKTKPATQH